MMRTALGALVCLVGALILVDHARGADEALKAVGLCSEVARYVNTLADFTDTKCLPGAGETKGQVDLIILSREAVFSANTAKKAWLMVVAGAVGKVSRDHPSIKLGRVLATDVSLIKKRTAYSFPASLAVTLQEQVSSDKISLDQFYGRLTAALKQVNVPETK